MNDPNQSANHLYYMKAITTNHDAGTGARTPRAALLGLADNDR